MPEKKIPDVAAELSRSYSWVYDHLRRHVGNAGCRKRFGVILINEQGVEKLRELDAQAPRRDHVRKGG